MVWCKFFTPDAAWTWYGTEGSPVDENGIMINEGETRPAVDYLDAGVQPWAAASQSHIECALHQI